MTIAFGSIGTGVAGAGTLNTLNVPYPTNVGIGDLLILWLAWKYIGNSAATPAGFTAPANNQAQGGTGVGPDAGSVVVTVFIRQADGTETGNLIVNLTDADGSAASVVVAQIIRYTKAPAKTWDFALAGGGDDIAGTAHSVTAGSDPGILANDFVVAVSSCNTDTPTRTAEAVTAPGVTFGAAVERNDGGNGGGDDIGFWISEHPVTAGASTGVPTYTSTHNSGTPTGATVLVRLRELDAVGSSFVALGAAASQGFGVITVEEDEEPPEPPAPTGTNAAKGIAMGRSSLRRVGKLAPIRTGNDKVDRAQDQVVAKLNQLLEHPLVEAIPVEATLLAGLNKVSHGARRPIRKFFWSCDQDGAVVSSRQADNPHPDRDFWCWLEGASRAKATLLLIPGI